MNHPLAKMEMKFEKGATRTTLVFLHGIGDGGVKNAWCVALRGALTEIRYPALDEETVIAPEYASLLREKPSLQCVPPKQTTRKSVGAEGDLERSNYERRQARLKRLLEDAGGNGANAFCLPEEVPQLVLMAPVLDVPQARMYVNDKGLRACVLNKVLDELPISGEVVIVGHSLGSLVAIDILDHLPPELTVHGLVTIGSPAGHVAMHGKHERLLKEFPYSRVKSWVNLWSVLDPVPLGKGAAHLFPAALDMRIKMQMGEHRGEAYLRNPVVATAIGEALFGSRSRELVQLQTAIDIPLDDHEKVIVAALAYGHDLSDRMKKKILRRDSARPLESSKRIGFRTSPINMPLRNARCRCGWPSLRTAGGRTPVLYLISANQSRSCSTSQRRM
ncbi:MAG TPA: hypothetical protein VND64_14700 [Pirellulales bacterium]|nr:hypothetical protein [Pirellulales bacterium]